jgi:hypothetical protein
MGRKFDWSRIDQTRSVAHVDAITLRVECDIDGCEWTVTSWARNRDIAVAQSEEAALAALRAPKVPDDRLDAILRQAHDGTAYLVVNGQREPHTLFEILRRARSPAKK